MPELPDVEGFRRVFRRHGVGKPVREVTADPRMVRNTTVPHLRDSLRGQRFTEPQRHGKWLTCPTDDHVLTLHFGMTGGLLWVSPDAEPPHPHDRLTLRFADGELRYRNQRMFGGIWFTELGHVGAVTGELGPDALRVTEREFRDRVAERRAGVKATLMNQRVVAGLGNLTADEILWRAGIDPRRPTTDLSAQDYRRLFDSTSQVLHLSVRAGRVLDRPGWFTGARSTPNPHCPRCGTALRRLTVAGRTTFVCPACQH